MLVYNAFVKLHQSHRIHNYFGGLEVKVSVVNAGGQGFRSRLCDKSDLETGTLLVTYHTSWHSGVSARLIGLMSVYCD